MNAPKLVFTAACLFFIYHIVTIKTPNAVNTAKYAISAPLAPEIPEESKKEIASYDNYFERKVAGIIASLSQTTEGQNLLKNVILTNRKSSSNQTSSIIDLPSKFQNYQFKTKSSGSTPKCGDIVNVTFSSKNYSYQLGLNKILPELDALIYTMASKDELDVVIDEVGKSKITLNSYIPSNSNEIITIIHDYPMKKIACGQKVFIDYSVYNNKNQLIFNLNKYLLDKKETKESQDLKLILSPDNVDIPILNSILKAGLGTKISLVLNQNQLYKLKNTKPFNLFLENSNINNETYVLEIELLAY